MARGMRCGKRAMRAAQGARGDRWGNTWRRPTHNLREFRAGQCGGRHLAGPHTHPRGCMKRPRGDPRLGWRASAGAGTRAFCGAHQPGGVGRHVAGPYWEFLCSGSIEIFPPHLLLFTLSSPNRTPSSSHFPFLLHSSTKGRDGDFVGSRTHAGDHVARARNVLRSRMDTCWTARRCRSKFCMLFCGIFSTILSFSILGFEFDPMPLCML